MKFFGRKHTKEQKPQMQVKDPIVREAARQALRKYEKTFIDLARYDRGEQIIPVSQ